MSNFNCFYCGSEIIWDSDSLIPEESELDNAGVVSFYHCSCCGRSYEISDPFIEEKETIYRNYWKS